MILKLTNASPDHIGKPLLINAKHILSVHEITQEVADKTFITYTNIYTVTQQSWSVKETLDEIYNKIVDIVN
jgi:uncharacterized protein YlzI (FlbEa/FlbD family)